jgi:hypothetical protein
MINSSNLRGLVDTGDVGPSESFRRRAIGDAADAPRAAAPERGEVTMF